MHIDAEETLILHPGDWYFGASYKHLYTLLGTCVAMTVWHSKLQIGGMCHFLLPEIHHFARAKALKEQDVGRYAEFVLPKMKQQMATMADLDEFHIGVFGGGNLSEKVDIGDQNVDYILDWLIQNSLQYSDIDVRGHYSRTLIMDLQSGTVNLKRVSYIQDQSN